MTPVLGKIGGIWPYITENGKLVAGEIVSSELLSLIETTEYTITAKLDGSCALIKNGEIWPRYDTKPGRTPPENWEATMEPDLVTGHQVGFRP